MNNGRAAILLCFCVAGLLSACADKADLRVEQGTGAQPVLPEPEPERIPTVNIAKATGWADGDKPAAASGLSVQAFASGLDHPRWLHVLPNGDVLVAESNAPPKPESAQMGGVKGYLMRRMMKKAGAAVPSANRISLLRDTDGDGVADLRTNFLENLYSPFGMALVNDTFYVANADAIVAFPYQTGQTQISSSPIKITDLPGGPLNHHWTKNIIASESGRYLYATVGSNSNIGENGMDIEAGRAAIWQVDLNDNIKRLFATGLRNPVGMTWEPTSSTLWTAVNERDMLGSDLVPDYMTSVQDGGFYGWPYSYFGQHIDERVQPQKPGLVATALVPDYALGPHTASLGLHYSAANALSERFHHGMFVGQHGSWNREPPSGYKVIFVPFEAGRPKGKPLDVLTGFRKPDDTAAGRPVGVITDVTGALLVADDVGNVIWRVVAN